MEFLHSRLKTDHTSDLSPWKRMLNASERKLFRLEQNRRSLERIRMMTSRSSPKLKRNFDSKTAQDRVIREENIRLISKIMEISHRKLKTKGNEVVLPTKKRDNPEREREITLENQVRNAICRGLEGQSFG